MKKRSVSVVLPVYNERRTVGSVIEVARTWPATNEVIVIDDGSTDGTGEILRSFGSRIRVITHKKNQGKGQALASGITASRQELLVFLDGDIVGLTHKDLEKLIVPLMDKRVHMTLGLVRFWRIHSRGPDKTITGVRALHRSAVLAHLRDMKRVGYGVEFLLNHIHKHRRVVSVDLPTVYIMSKLEKLPFHKAIGGYILELWELGRETVRQK